MVLVEILFIALSFTTVHGDLQGLPDAPKALLMAFGDKKGYRVWDDKGTVGRYNLIVWEANAPPNNWYLLGQRGQANYKDLEATTHSFKVFTNATFPESNLLVKPTGFSFIWDSRGGSTYDPGSIWRPTCPSGFVAIGDFFHRDARLSEPPASLYDKVRCVRDDLTERCAGWKAKLWDNQGAYDDRKASVWAGEPREATAMDTNFLYANSEINLRPNLIPKCLKKIHVAIVD